MDANDLTNAAKGLQDKAQQVLNNPKVQDAINKGKDWLENTDAKKYIDDGIAKGKEWLDSDTGKEYIAKGKDALAGAKDKIDDFIADKTDGKGILGFGKKD